MNKEDLRKAYLAKRLALSTTEVLQLSQQLYHLFFVHIDLSFVKVLHLYLPAAKFNEPDTWPILDRVRREMPHIRIALPKVNKQNNTIDHIFFEGLHQLESNGWGIQEPRSGVPAEPHQMDMVIVPLLACDKEGYRIGYGKGYYDRFLADCRPDCQGIGLSLFELEDKIPHEDHDVPLDACITPEAFIKF